MAFILIFILGQLIIKTGDYSYIILLAVYGVDTVLTIVHRLILKKNIFKAHRKHVYQMMANELKIPHVVVSLIYASLQAIIAIGFFVFKSHSYLYLGIVILILSVLYVLFKMKYFHLYQIPSEHPKIKGHYGAGSLKTVRIVKKQAVPSNPDISNT